MAAHTDGVSHVDQDQMLGCRPLVALAVTGTMASRLAEPESAGSAARRLLPAMPPPRFSPVRAAPRPRATLTALQIACACNSGRANLSLASTDALVTWYADATDCVDRPARLSPGRVTFFEPTILATAVPKLSCSNAIQERTPSPYCCELIATGMGVMVRFPDLALSGRIGKSRPGAAGLMTSFLGWRRAFKSAVMMRDRSPLRAGTGRTMGSYRQSLQHVLAGAAVGAMTLASPVLAADMPLKAPALKAVYQLDRVLSGRSCRLRHRQLRPGHQHRALARRVLPPQRDGTDRRLPGRLRQAVREQGRAGYRGRHIVRQPGGHSRLAPAPFNSTIDYIATARGRVGYAMGTWMPYVTGGLAWGSTHVNLNDLGVIIRRSGTSRISAGPPGWASRLPSAATGPPRPNTITSIWPCLLQRWPFDSALLRSAPLARAKAPARKVARSGAPTPRSPIASGA